MEWFKEHAGYAYMIVGCICAWVMAMLRSGGFTTKDLRSRLTEACMCSMLTSALWFISTGYLHLDDRLVIPIGTFVGFLGTYFVRTIIDGLVKNKGISNDKQEHD